MNRTTLVAIVALVTLAMTALFFHQSNTRPKEYPTNGNIAETPDQPTSTPSSQRSMSQTDGDPDCLTPMQLETHPMFADEYERIRTLLANGPEFDNYRGVGRDVLESYAAQGDSAAMVVIGAMEQLKVHDIQSNRAIDYINHADETLGSFRIPRPLPAEWIDGYSNAAHWYYQAALHGRVSALWRYGDALFWTEGGAVELGWITREDYESLSRGDRTMLNPSNAYNLVAYELVPEYDSSILRMIRSIGPKNSEQIQSVIDSLKQEFVDDLEQAGLSLPSLPPTKLPAEDELRDLLCPQYRDQGE